MSALHQQNKGIQLVFWKLPQLDISTQCANRHCTKHFPKFSWYSALALLYSTNIKCDPRSLLISFPLTPFIHILVHRTCIFIRWILEFKYIYYYYYYDLSNIICRKCMYRNFFDKSRSTPNFMNLSEIKTLNIMPYSALKRRELFNYLLNFFPEEHIHVHFLTII